MEDLMHKVLSGNASKEEQSALDAWLALSPENQKTFDEQQALWGFLGHGSLFSEVDENMAWDTFVAKNSSPKKSMAPLYKLAAVFLLALTVGGIFYMSNKTVPTASKQVAKKHRTNKSHVKEVKPFISANEVSDLKKSLKKFQKKKDTSFRFQDVVLLDSSLVKISDNSVLKVLDQSPKQPRIASLSGAGLFDIKPADQAFVLETEQLKIKVQGTKFNIITPTETYNFVEISVEEGFMEVEEKANPQNKVTITSNQKYLFDVEKHQFVEVKPATLETTKKRKTLMEKIFRKNNYKH